MAKEYVVKMYDINNNECIRSLKSFKSKELAESYKFIWEVNGPYSAYYKIEEESA